MNYLVFTQTWELLIRFFHDKRGTLLQKAGCISNVPSFCEAHNSGGSTIAPILLQRKKGSRKGDKDINTTCEIHLTTISEFSWACKNQIISCLKLWPFKDGKKVSLRSDFLPVNWFSVPLTHFHPLISI